MDCGLFAADSGLLAVGLSLFALWEQVVIGAIAFAIWLINQFVAARNKPAPPQRNPQAGPRPGGPKAGGAKGLLDEVEQFLKDARKQMERPKQPPQRIQPPPQQQQARKPKQKQAKPRPQPLRSSAEPRILDDSERRHTVAEHVADRLATDRFDTSRFDERAGRLSSLQQTIEQDIGAHVRSVFDHQVGTMTTGSALSAPPVEAPAAPTPAQQLIAMLRDPQGMRNAILVQEILRPPVERW